MPLRRGLALSALSLMGIGPLAQSGDSGPAAMTSIVAPPLGAGASLGDLLDHPSLQGFAGRTLPWHGRTYDRSLPLEHVGSLLPYHSNVDPAAVLAGLNLLIGNARSGVPVFHEIYSGAEKERNPGLRATGLFFFPAREGQPFALIAPGGGFSYVGSLHEGFPYAAEINAHGYNAFVVVYRTGLGARAATEDMSRALDYILARTDQLGVASSGYSLWGSSAGARMAAYIGSHGAEAYGGTAHPAPAAVVMAYTGHSDVSDHEPPTFAVAGGRDRIAPPRAMEGRIAALRASGVEVDYHLYKTLGHGFGAGSGTEADGWIGVAVAFWERQIGKAGR